MPALESLTPWLAVAMIAIDAAWLAAVWWVGGPRLRAAALVAAALTVAWALTITGVLPLDGLRTPAIDLTGVCWHGVIAPAATLICVLAPLGRRLVRRSVHP